MLLKPRRINDESTTNQRRINEGINDASTTNQRRINHQKKIAPLAIAEQVHSEIENKVPKIVLLNNDSVTPFSF